MNASTFLSYFAEALSSSLLLSSFPSYCLIIIQVVTFSLCMRALVEEGYGQNVSEWVGKAETQQKQWKGEKLRRKWTGKSKQE